MINRNKLKEYELMLLNVRRDYRCCGLGKLLSEIRLKRIAELGASHTVMDAFLWPSTQKYHEKFGFVKIDRDARMKDHAIVMKKDLRNYVPGKGKEFAK
jgi:N-acetylglutamate synthase-like GNAT family acetyltransferase